VEKTSRRILALSLFLIVSIQQQTDVFCQNEYDVLKGSWLEYTDSQNSLYHHLTGQAYALLKERAEKTSSINNLAGWQLRQKEIRQTLEEIGGPFPEKTPLNPRITRTIEKKNYRVEHIIFESQPGFYVTSSLYIPSGLKRKVRAPAIIYCSGHAAEGYRSAVYQYVILNLVMKGFIVFAFDPVGQGERLEYFTKETGKSIFGGPTKEHSYPGAQAFIAGSSQAMYMIWDGIRAVDYLMTRKEVDPARIGITGRSGGGTQSAYIAAFDERIHAAAPENYITNYTRLLQSIGPQDAEQNLFNIIARGLDQPDFLIVRAPRPALMITTTRDMFSIQGAIETEMEVSSIYKAYGKEDNFSRTEDDAGHETTLKNRETMYAFFRKHLNNPGNSGDEEVQLLSADELRVTETGQVSTSLTGESVFSLNKKVAMEAEAKLDQLRKDHDGFLPLVIRSARDLSGYVEPGESRIPVLTGRIQRDGYKIEKYFVKGEGEYVIPYLLFKPENPGQTAMIYLHPGGKSVEAGAGGEIEQFVNEGITVLAADLPGIGELGPGALTGDAYFNGVSHNLWYASMLTGRSITGIQAGEISRLAGILKWNNNEVQIAGFARRELTPALLHSAAFSTEIKSVILCQPFSSFLSIVTTRFYDPALICSTVPGALKEYDLPDLASALAPRKLCLAGTKDVCISGNDTEGITRDLGVVRNAYGRKNADMQLRISADISIENIIKFLEE
jgi:Acetyl xylan esterase (AXE1)